MEVGESKLLIPERALKEHPSGARPAGDFKQLIQSAHRDIVVALAPELFLTEQAKAKRPGVKPSVQRWKNIRNVYVNSSLVQLSKANRQDSKSFLVLRNQNSSTSIQYIERDETRTMEPR